MHLVWMAVKLFKMICSKALTASASFEKRTPKIQLKIRGDHPPLANFFCISANHSSSIVTENALL